MLNKLVLSGLLALGLLAVSAEPSQAQYIVQSGGYYPGNHHHHHHHGGFYSAPVIVAPRPIVVGSSYPWGTFGSPYFAPSFGSPAFISPSPFFGGYPGYGIGRSFGTVGIGYSRPGFGINVGFIIR